MSRTISSRKAISQEAAVNFYNWLGARYDWVDFIESKAKSQGIKQLDLHAGHTLLNAGCGTGKDHNALIEAVSPGGKTIALDLSWEMIKLTSKRTQDYAIQSAIGILPIKDSSVDRVFASYVLDLIPANHLSLVLSEFMRVLRPGGKMVNISLSRGHSISSKLIIAGWLILFDAAPLVCGGCRPIEIYGLAKEAGFKTVMWEIVEQSGFPSEIITAVR